MFQALGLWSEASKSAQGKIGETETERTKWCKPFKHYFKQLILRVDVNCQKLTKTRVYQELVYRNEAFKQCLQTLLLSPIPPSFSFTCFARPLSLALSALIERLTQAKIILRGHPLRPI